MLSRAFEKNRRDSIPPYKSPEAVMELTYHELEDQARLLALFGKAVFKLT